MWSIAGLRPAMLHMKGPLKTRKAGISRVCVKASPAFGRRRLHTKTDSIDCPRPFLFLFLFNFFFFLFFFMLTFEMVREAKSKLAEVEIGRSRTGRTRKKKLAEVEIGRSRNWPKSTTTELKRGLGWLLVEHCRLKTGNVQQKGPLRVQRWVFGSGVLGSGQGFRGFRGSGVQGLGVQGSGFRV